MIMKEVIETELKCVQRDCCRLENECAKCDLVLPKEEIVNAYNEALKLEEENEELKKNVLVWHKVTCFDKPDENGYITANNPAEEGKDYLVLLKNKRILISTLGYDDDGYFFEGYDWEDIEAWAELPFVEA